MSLGSIKRTVLVPKKKKIEIYESKRESLSRKAYLNLNWKKFKQNFNDTEEGISEKKQTVWKDVEFFPYEFWMSFFMLILTYRHVYFYPIKNIHLFTQ